MKDLSVIIITKNEEENILDCLENLKLVSEIIIIDDYSTDRTTEVIDNLAWDNVRVYKNKLDGNFSTQRNFGLSKVKNEWVMFLDADERVSGKMLSEISEKTKNENYDGFYIRRKDVLWGKKLNHGETGNMKLIRLAKKSAGIWYGNVHEEWRVKGKIGLLKNELIHYPHQGIREFLSEINLYSTIRAKELKQKSIGVSIFDIIVYPKAKFFLNYFIKLGFMDGIPGLLIALMMSFHSFLVRGKLWLSYQK